MPFRSNTQNGHICGDRKIRSCLGLGMGKRAAATDEDSFWGDKVFSSRPQRWLHNSANMQKICWIVHFQRGKLHVTLITSQQNFLKSLTGIQNKQCKVSQAYHRKCEQSYKKEHLKNLLSSYHRIISSKISLWALLYQQDRNRISAPTFHFKQSTGFYSTKALDLLLSLHNCIVAPRAATEKTSSWFGKEQNKVE